MAVADFTAMLEQEPYNSIARTYRGKAYAKMVGVKKDGFSFFSKGCAAPGKR